MVVLFLITHTRTHARTYMHVYVLVRFVCGSCNCSPSHMIHTHTHTHTHTHMGQVRVWQLQRHSFECLREVNEAEVKGDAINCLRIDRTGMHRARALLRCI